MLSIPPATTTRLSPSLIAWAKDHYQQSIPGNLGLEKVRERAKGFVDQYGAP